MLMRFFCCVVIHFFLLFQKFSIPQAESRVLLTDFNCIMKNLGRNFFCELLQQCPWPYRDAHNRKKHFQNDFPTLRTQASKWKMLLCERKSWLEFLCVIFFSWYFPKNILFFYLSPERSVLLSVCIIHFSLSLFSRENCKRYFQLIGKLFLRRLLPKKKRISRSE